MLGLADRYVPVAPSRLGSASELWTAKDRVSGRVVVLKLADARSPSARRLALEAERLGDLGHARLVACLERYDGAPGFTRGQSVVGFSMPWLEGVRLDAAAAGRSLEDRILLFGAVLGPVAYLHNRGVLHLDLKPSNILVERNGPVLLDLGTAQDVGDAAPAGGTLGFAAPEVLRGDSPGEQADVFPLGAVLYNLLCGRFPFVGQGEDLVQEVLSGAHVPIRAVDSSLPPLLARLVEDMLAKDIQRRPATMHEVAARLGAAGFPTSVHDIGAPPFLGRARELRDLGELFEGPPTVVALVGDEGSGRDRLARRALGGCLSDAAQLVVNLSEVSDPIGAVRGFEKLYTARDERSWLYFGDIDALDAQARASLLAALERLAATGTGSVVCSSRVPGGTRPFHLPRLGLSELTTLARFGGITPGPALMDALDASGQLPGPLLRSHSSAGASLPPDLEGAWRCLRSLPRGIPSDVIDQLPSWWAQAVAALVTGDVARWRTDGALVVVGATPGPIPADFSSLVAQALRRVDKARVARHWLALTLCRLGCADEASLYFDVDGVPGTTERLELLESLTLAGHEPAAMKLHDLRVALGDTDGALRALDHVRDAAPWRARVLRAADRLDAAREVLDRAACTPELRLERAALAIRTADLGAADAELVACAPELPATRTIALRVALAAERVRLGQQVALEGLIDEVMAADISDVPPHALAQCGRVLLRQGDATRAVGVLRVAVRFADEAGDQRTAVAVRATLANALLSLGQGTDARRAYGDALYGARALGHDGHLTRILYSLTELELRSGRLVAAERWLAEYLEISTRSPSPEVAIRGLLLQAEVAEQRGDHAAILPLLGSVDRTSLPQELQCAVATALASALLALGKPEAALAEIKELRATGTHANRTLELLRGRALLQLARGHLSQARALVPDEVGRDHLDRGALGRVLLAYAGEDLASDTLQARRRDLKRAAELLDAREASQAADLRDRFLGAPGASLSEIVSLLETLRDPEKFPRALARLVGEALGANRVLIVMRIPGLGRQVGVTELTQSEVAGISEEVLRRITSPHDVWLSHDAYADPEIRRASATVRSFEIRSVLAVAIPSGDRAIGALYIDDLHRVHRFTDADVAIMHRLARAVAHLVGMLVPASRPPVLAEPLDLLGVLLTNEVQIANMRDAVESLRAQRSRHVNLLLTGATGTGKTWLARRIAREVLGLQGLVEQTMRQTEPDKLVSTLAGTRRGEFTGSLDEPGAIKRALGHRRALFLDEVQALGDDAQTALLPLLEVPVRRFARLTGDADTIDQPLAVILGTNVDVSGGRWKSHFRQDLWYRMSQVHIHLPTLAERGPEVVYRYFANFLREEAVSAAPEQVLTAAALQQVVGAPWPGNLRQLGTVAKEIALRHVRGSRILDVGDLPALHGHADAVGPSAAATPLTHSDPLTTKVWSLLERLDWSQTAVAEDLGCSVSKVSRLLKKAGLSDEVRSRRARKFQ